MALTYEEISENILEGITNKTPSNKVNAEELGAISQQILDYAKDNAAAGGRFGIEDNTTPENTPRTIDLGANVMKFKNSGGFIFQGEEELQFVEAAEGEPVMAFYPDGIALMPELEGYGVMYVEGQLIDSSWPEETEVWFYDEEDNEIIYNFEKYLLEGFGVYVYRYLFAFTTESFYGAVIPVIVGSTDIYFNADNYGTIEEGDWVYSEDTLGRLVRRTYTAPELPSYPDMYVINATDQTEYTWPNEVFGTSLTQYLINDSGADCNWTLPGNTNAVSWGSTGGRTVVIIAKGKNVTVNARMYKDGPITSITTDGTLTLFATNNNYNGGDLYWYVMNVQPYEESGGATPTLQQVLDAGYFGFVGTNIAMASMGTGGKSGGLGLGNVGGFGATLYFEPASGPASSFFVNEIDGLALIYEGVKRFNVKEKTEFRDVVAEYFDEETLRPGMNFNGVIPSLGKVLEITSAISAGAYSGAVLIFEQVGGATPTLDTTYINNTGDTFTMGIIGTGNYSITSSNLTRDYVLRLTNKDPDRAFKGNPYMSGGVGDFSQIDLSTGLTVDNFLDCIIEIIPVTP